MDDKSRLPRWRFVLAIFYALLVPLFGSIAIQSLANSRLDTGLYLALMALLLLGVSCTIMLGRGSEFTSSPDIRGRTIFRVFLALTALLFLYVAVQGIPAAIQRGDIESLALYFSYFAVFTLLAAAVIFGHWTMDE